jgi:hypothetical protein
VGGDLEEEFVRESKKGGLRMRHVEVVGVVGGGGNKERSG